MNISIIKDLSIDSKDIFLQLFFYTRRTLWNMLIENFSEKTNIFIHSGTNYRILPTVTVSL